ncbi:MAG: CapA family protein [Actinomycetota bacterium]
MRNRLAVVVLAAVAFAAGMAIFNATDDDETSSETEVAAETTTTTATTTSTTTTTTTTTTTVPPPRTARLAFTGDLLPHGSVQRAGTAFVDEGWDFAPLYDEVRPIIEGADLAICHLETPISIDDTNLSGYPLFAAPRAFAQAALDVGYDGCSLASNHSYDRGAQGALDTISVLQDIGLPYAGQAASVEEDLAPVLYEVNDITIAHISATYSLNGFVMPADRQYLVDLIDPEAILQEARIAKEAGAEFVIVSMHWGAEYRHEPISSQNEWLEATLPSEYVDLIIGHHAHVVQPVDKVGDEWVVFGLGNFLSNQSANCCVAASQDGMIATVELLENDAGVIEAVGVHYIPTWVDRADGYRIRVADPDRTDLPDATNDQMGVTFDRTFDVVSSRLGEADGLTIGLGLAPGDPSVIPAVSPDAAPADDG